MVSIYLLTMLLSSSFADKVTLPVFLLDYDHSLAHVQIEPNPLSKLSSGSFASILKSALKYSEGVIIFVEESFCVDDITIKDSSGSPYNYLQQGLSDKSVKYFPAVKDSFKTLEDMFPPKVYNQFSLKPGVPLVLGDLKYIYVYFEDDISDPRPSVLRKHDLLMKDVYFMFRQSKPGPVVAFYTGKMNPCVTSKLGYLRQKSEDTGVKIASAGALFKFTGVFATTPLNRRSMFNHKPTVEDETYTRQKLSTKVAYINFDVQFNFTFEEKAWVLDSVGLLEEGEEVGRTQLAVGAPWGRSFMCADPLIILNTRDGSSVTISKYQIEPRFRRQNDDDDDESSDEYDETETSTDQSTDESTNKSTDKSTQKSKDKTTKRSKDKTKQTTHKHPDKSSDRSSDKFGDPVNCGPYFSSGILSCLLVVFICLVTLFYGVVCLFDVHTNDRYDDPLGKQLVLVER